MKEKKKTRGKIARVCRIVIAVAMALVFGFVFAGCGDPPGDDDSKADTSKLKAKITEAQTLADATQVSDSNGSDVPMTAQWVTQEVKTTFQNAINTAKGVEKKPGTQSKVDSALKTLNNAVSAFTNARKPGTAASVNYTGLNAKITEAESEKTSVVVATAATEVAEGMYWVTSAVMTTFENAINTAKDAKSATTQQAVDAAVTALEGAITTFKNAKQAGNKTEGFSKGEFETLIAMAKAARTGVLVDTNGDDTSPSIYWVTQTVLNNFNSAITTAESALSSSPYDTAYNNLVAAMTTFNSAKTLGTTPDREDLQSMIEEIAEALAEEYFVIAENANQAPYGSNWVTPAQWSAFNTVYLKALAIFADSNATKNMVDEVTEELDEAGNKLGQDIDKNGPGKKINTITITGWSGKYNDAYVEVGLFKTATPADEEIESPEIFGDGIIEDGELVVNLWTSDDIDQKPWTGTGSYFVGLKVDGDELLISKAAIPFTTAAPNPSRAFSDFKPFVIVYSTIAGELAEAAGIVIPPGGMTLDAFFMEGAGSDYDTYVLLTGFILYKDSDLTTPFTGGETIYNNTVFYTDFPLSDGGKGEEIGELTGSIYLTDIPASISKIEIGIYGNGFDGSDYYDWYSYGKVDITGTANGTYNWSIPVYSSDDFVPGVNFECYFYLHIVFNDGTSFDIDINGAKNISNLDTPVGSLGAVSLKNIALNGTLSVTYEGTTVPQVYIMAYWDRSGEGDWVLLGETQLVLPGANAAWTIRIPVQPEEITVVFDVAGFDSKWSILFSEEELVPTLVKPTDTTISGITLNLGDITSGNGGGSMPSIKPEFQRSKIVR